MDRVDRDEIVRTLRGLLPELTSRYRVKSIFLFGSVVRRESKPDSDIDILAEFEEGADLFDLMGLAGYLEEQLRHKVDVVSKNGLREELRESVAAEAIQV